MQKILNSLTAGALQRLWGKLLLQTACSLCEILRITYTLMLHGLMGHIHLICALLHDVMYREDSLLARDMVASL